MVMLTNLYKITPPDQASACAKAIRFLDGGETHVPEDDDEDESDTVQRFYSFEKDAQLIFAAFYQTHGVDLESANMHWYKFLTLFMDLGGDTAFSGLVGLRRRVKTGKASKEEKAMARELGSIFDVPDLDLRTVDEREQERIFLAQIGQGAKQWQ